MFYISRGGLETPINLSNHVHGANYINTYDDPRGD